MNTWKQDAPASLVVFLVALPLCLGIALASGAPLFSGIMAGIIGGIVTGALSGSQVSVSGPAAGLAVIVATAIASLGAFSAFQAAVLLAGLLQLLLGWARLGGLGSYVPNPVIKGMLAAIGMVIILKQIPHAVGRDTDYEGDFSFLEKAGDNTLTDIVKALYASNGEAILISVLSLLLLMLWELPRFRRFTFFQVVPGALVVVLMGTLLNEYWKATWPDFHLRAEDGHLVALPVVNSWRELGSVLSFPDAAAFMRQDVWLVALTIAIVASLETLLSLEAADRLDPLHRSSSPHRELLAQGAGNLLCGMLGGIPLTSVVVRTSANAYAGALSRWSAILHGMLLLLAAALFPGLLNKVPLSCLAAILIMVGYKLTKKDVFAAMWRGGWDLFLPFIVTVVGIVFTDLLKGVMLGLAAGLFFVLRANHHAALTMVSDGENVLLRFNKDVSFVNKSELREKLSRVPSHSKLLIDGSRAIFIDKDIYDELEYFNHSARFRNIEVTMKSIENKYSRKARHAA
jgi:MFS superfamily sulfate permease-like transporter